MSYEFCTLAELIENHGGLIQTGPFGSQLHQHEYVDSGIPVVMPKDIVGGRIDDSSIAMVSENKANALKLHKLKQGDIVFPRRGDIRKCALVDKNHEGYLCGTGCLKITIPCQKYSPRFLYYYLILPKVGEWLERNAVGTTMLNLNTSIIGGVSIPDKGIKDQEEIVAILSAYDDLIENNRRRIQLLEESARLLYREWFVRLRFPGHEHVKVVDGVPEGWSQRPVPDVIQVKPKEKVEKDKKIRYIPMSCLSESGMTINHSGIEERKKSTSVKFRNGDVLFARITPCLENGKTGYVNILENGELACGSTEFIVLRGKKVSSYYTYCLSRTYDFRENAIKSMIGSSGRQRVQESCFEEYLVYEPPKQIQSLFDENVGTIFHQIKKLSEQNYVLAQARDLLLPRLMNGEVAL